MKKYILVLLLVFSFLLCGCIQQKTYTVTGQVVGLNSGEPVEGLKISFGDYGTAVTNSKGKFSKSGLKDEVKVKPLPELKTAKFDPGYIKVNSETNIKFEKYNIKIN